MRNLLIGSRALNYWYPEHKIKDTTDWDVISDEHIDGTEWHHPEFLNNYKLERFASGCTVEINGNELHVVTPAGLALIKRSHLWRDLSWDKHVAHFHKHLSFEFAKTLLWAKDYKELLKERTELSYKAFPQQGPKLSQSVEDFFDDAVTKKYNHDSLHEIYAYEDKPMYTKLQRDTSTAMCHKDLWLELTYEQKLQCVAEEAMVIATERFLVPNDWNYDSKRAYYAAVKKICTTLCKGWFRDHAIDYYPQVLQLYNKRKFLAAKQEIMKLPVMIQV